MANMCSPRTSVRLAGSIKVRHKSAVASPRRIQYRGSAKMNSERTCYERTFKVRVRVRIMVRVMIMVRVRVTIRVLVTVKVRIRIMVRVRVMVRVPVSG